MPILRGEQHPFYGKRHSPEQRAKWSRERKGKISAPEALARLHAAQVGSANPFYGRQHSDEQRAKWSAQKMGRTHTPETRAKMSATRASNPELWAHLIRPKGRPLSEAHRAAISRSRKGQPGQRGPRRPLSPQHRLSVGLAQKGKPKPWAQGMPNLKLRGPNAWNWKGGGRQHENARLRTRTEYWTWRAAVWVRDDYTCQRCRTRGGAIVAHHIRPFVKYEALRYEPLNGITLCDPCHRAVHKLREPAFFQP